MAPLKQTFLFLAIFCSFSLLAQDQMERLYRSNRQNAALDVAQTSDNGYLILSAGREPDSTNFDFYTITKLDDKGNLSWSMDYQFEEKIEPNGSLHLLESDSFLITGSLFNTPKKHRFILKGDPSGNVSSTKGFENGENDNEVFLYQVPIDASYRNGYISGGIYTDGAGTLRLSWLGELDADGEYLWSKTYTNPTHDIFLFENIGATRDSGLIVCGGISDNSLVPDLFLMKTDSLGEIEWSRKYGDFFSEGATTVTQTSDDGFLIGGLGGATDFLGILIKTDTIGQIEWAANIDFGVVGANVIIHQLIIGSDGNAVVAGSLFGPNDNFAFMVKVDMDGNVIWKRKYKSSTDQQIVKGLMESPAGGFVFLTTSEENDEQVGPYLIKTNDDGETLCDTAIMEDLLVPISIPTDTLSNVATDDIVNSLDVLVADTLNYGGFNPPTVSLENFGPFCPNEPFSVTYDATVTGAIAYEWDGGETTPTLTVTEPGEYMVTVTMGEDYCYILCASQSISEIPEPEVTIQQDADSFCITGDVILNANAVGTIQTIDWSTGEMQTTNIQVGDPGNYSVTVTNQCNDSATDALNLAIDDGPPSISIASAGTFCQTGADTLFAVIIPIYLNSISWSTGESSPSIIVEAQGTYTATVSTEFCGDNSADIEITCPVDLEVPNAFTPNNDDINDEFKPVHLFSASDFLEYKFAVYNRWGEKVFETTNPDDAWDGKIDGENAVSDVYMWTLEGRTQFFEISDAEDRAGDVTLIR